VLPFTETFLTFVGSTVIPAIGGLVLVAVPGRWVGTRYVTAFAIGIFFWFFVDTIEGSAKLDVNAGFAGGAAQAAEVLLFLVGALLFFSADKAVFSQEPTMLGHGFVTPMLAALAIGIHGFGEGAAFGSLASLTSSTSLLDAMGGLSAGVAYVFHKILEPMIIGALYVSYFDSSTKRMQGRMNEILFLTLLFVLPSAIGVAIGYFIPHDVTYSFALATGTSTYVAFRLSRQVFSDRTTSGRYESIKVSLALIIGVMIIYFASLFHSA